MKWLYDINENNSARYTLGEYEDTAAKTLLCFGINPSTATPQNLDNTIKRIKTISKNNGYINWVMLNLYPQRATNPQELHIFRDVKLTLTNLFYIKKVLSDFANSDILFAYGNLISTRDYFVELLTNIISQIKCSNWNGRILCIKLSKMGHPVHPLYQPSSSPLIEFSI